jgi:hypothetical protein
MSDVEMSQTPQMQLSMAPSNWAIALDTGQQDSRASRCSDCDRWSDMYAGSTRSRVETNRSDMSPGVSPRGVNKSSAICSHVAPVAEVDCSASSRPSSFPVENAHDSVIVTERRILKKGASFGGQAPQRQDSKKRSLPPPNEQSKPQRHGTRTLLPYSA